MTIGELVASAKFLLAGDTSPLPVTSGALLLIVILAELGISTLFNISAGGLLTSDRPPAIGALLSFVATIGTVPESVSALGGTTTFAPIETEGAEDDIVALAVAEELNVPMLAIGEVVDNVREETPIDRLYAIEIMGAKDNNVRAPAAGVFCP